MSPSSSTHTQLLAHLEAVARPRHLHWNRLGLLAVRSYLQDCLSVLGPVEEHGFDEGQGEGINLILRLPGRNDDLEPLLVGAHYDGPLESIGADDNGSGSTALARELRRSRGDFIAVVGNTGAARFLPGLVRRMGEHVSTKVLPVPDKDRSLPDGRLSDHSPFRNAVTVGLDAGLRGV
jgi:hypothetical protein